MNSGDLVFKKGEGEEEEKKKARNEQRRREHGDNRFDVDTSISVPHRADGWGE